MKQEHVHLKLYNGVSFFVNRFVIKGGQNLVIEIKSSVMYGSAVWFLGLSRGIGSCMYFRGALQYTMLISGFSGLCTLRQNIRKGHDYCIQLIYLFIMTIYFYYYNTMHRYINTHLSV